jgi:type IV secretory pathway TrbF-like protein
LTQEEMGRVMTDVFAECHELRKAGQKEYAHDMANAFQNFESLSRDLKLDRKKILWVYAKKHIDGIIAAINGHVSQREPVKGRIEDLIVYLCLLQGMFIEDQKSNGD